MNGYAWVIDRDHLDGDAKGTTGPSTAPQPLLDALTKGEGVRFRMYDDDGELYYTGRIVALHDDGTRQTAKDCGDEFFGPLTDFGGPGAGCTYIQYRNTESKEWETL